MNMMMMMNLNLQCHLLVIWKIIIVRNEHEIGRKKYRMIIESAVQIWMQGNTPSIINMINMHIFQPIMPI